MMQDDEYTYDNQIFKMTQHGFARDMDFKIMEQEDSMVLLQLNADHNTLKAYPFYFTFLHQHYHPPQHQYFHPRESPRPPRLLPP